MKTYKACELTPVARVVPVEQVRKTIGRILREEMNISPNDPKYKETIDKYMKR